MIVFLSGPGIGIVGGMIGLGGAEFRLPLLIGLFGFAALPAIIMNKAMSLVVVITAIVARLISVPLVDLSPFLYVVANLLAGSLVGAWLGAHWATKLASKTLYRVIAILLVLIAILVFVTHFFAIEPLNLPDIIRIILGGLTLGIVSSIILIPLLVLLLALSSIKVWHHKQPSGQSSAVHTQRGRLKPSHRGEIDLTRPEIVSETQTLPSRNADTSAELKLLDDDAVAVVTWIRDVEIEVSDGASEET